MLMDCLIYAEAQMLFDAIAVSESNAENKP